VSYPADVVAVFGGRDFRRLLSVRMVGQLADGVFQTAVASYVLFSPERQTDPRAIAAAFATLLLPYCLLGPFAGVLIDRWRRRQVLLAANLARAGLVVLISLIAVSPAPEAALLAVAVVAISINRFVLAALGAALPRVVDGDRLVTANALSPTLGTLATVSGAGIGYLIRQAAGGAGDSSDALVMASAAGCYLIASLLALRLALGALGPAADEIIDDARAALASVGAGLRDGLAELRRTTAALDAYVVIAAQRFGFGVATVTAVLLMRNTFNDPADPDAGLAGLATAVTVTGVGLLTGALLTPWGVARWGMARWLVAALSLGACTQVAIALLDQENALLVCAALVGVTAQSVKVGVDSTLQSSMDDGFRGRTFAIYDVVFNATFVLAAVAAAFAMPTSGVAPVFMILTGAVYAAAAIYYARRRGLGIRGVTRSRPR
jgi:MFS family permease